ncbi:MAG: hypothetical protein GF353_24555 [Candidatus Lokiarchaeota archaeon]|nr:hypothetical protein [Candidatus Lokiarchaeota archaeon]
MHLSKLNDLHPYRDLCVKRPGKEQRQNPGPKKDSKCHSAHWMGVCRVAGIE